MELKWQFWMIGTPLIDYMRDQVYFLQNCVVLIKDTPTRITIKWYFSRPEKEVKLKRQ